MKKQVSIKYQRNEPKDIWLYLSDKVWMESEQSRPALVAEWMGNLLDILLEKGIIDKAEFCDIISVDREVIELK